MPVNDMAREIREPGRHRIAARDWLNGPRKPTPLAPCALSWRDGDALAREEAAKPSPPFVYRNLRNILGAASRLARCAAAKPTVTRFCQIGLFRQV
jgi:hypothetical protein